jgi:sterol desaturase/sphingolipid hydroxylase (fatty acid hydroxylase superfamily)
MIYILLSMLVAMLVMGFITTFLGYVVHWIFHQPWSLWFYDAHMNHHQIQYPPTIFFSDKYKSAGRNSTVWLFVIAFAPVFLGIVLLTYLGILSLLLGAYSMFSLIVWGWVHDYFHDQFHLTNTPWKSLPFFLKWRDIHYVHHLDMSKNYGIVLFQWDKLFKTFSSEEDIKLH